MMKEKEKIDFYRVTCFIIIIILTIMPLMLCTAYYTSGALVGWVVAMLHIDVNKYMYVCIVDSISDFVLSVSFCLPEIIQHWNVFRTRSAVWVRDGQEFFPPLARPLLECGPFFCGGGGATRRIQ